MGGVETINLEVINGNLFSLLPLGNSFSSFFDQSNMRKLENTKHIPLDFWILS